MPEPGWNPYRWVRVSTANVSHALPQYHHCFQGLSGRFECTLETLTPLFVGDGRGRFVGLAGPRARPVIPGTSLKGAFRSLTELVGNATVPFPTGLADPAHQSSRASQGQGVNWSLDVAARMFGYLDGGQAFTGLVRFSDAEFLASPVQPGQWREMRVVGGQPRPQHAPFYPAQRDARKLYHHKTGANELTRPPGNIPESQIRAVRPAPAGTTFRFRVDFANLRREELELLTYVLVLEPSVTVTLSAAALGPGFPAAVTLHGPLRHKIGGCKPLGGGSVEIRVDRLTLRPDPAARYRQGGSRGEVLESPALDQRLAQYSGSFLRSQEPLMPDTFRELRAMMIYDKDDPRPTALDYPSYSWFQTDAALPSSQKNRLKPTL